MMDTFVVDKPFYDAEEFKELWDENDLDPTMQGVLGDFPQEWALMERDVILHDKLMTDAALGNRPIKTEHSYSLASDGDSLPDSDISHHHKVDDMDDEYTITINPTGGPLGDSIEIKDEPLSEPDSPNSSCPSSPQSTMINANDLHYDVEMAPATTTSQTGKRSSLLLSSPHNIIPPRINILPKLNIKVEAGTNSFSLPPTPPSYSGSEDSEDNGTISQPSSPAARKTTTRMIMNHHTSTRQPINTPLISSQPKGSTGTLLLTEEEKRTLIAEGYPVPTRLPLTKAEEKSLKKIRRKIKNKISAQESRRKKKEYMDQLERRVEILVSENSEFQKKIKTLENSNTSLLSQLQMLQTIVARTHPQVVKQLKQQQ